jgi:hypothetical protein
MSKPVAVIGTNGRLANSYVRETADMFADVGANTGNLAFQYATWHAFTDEKYLESFNFDPSKVKERARLICLPAANFLYSGFDLGGLADRLEATELPVMVLGLGAQAFRNIDEVVLKPGTRRLLDVLAERCKTIMIRGKHTGAVLERLGVQNFEVLGCPSNFINTNPDLGAEIHQRWRTRRETFAYAPTFYSYNAEFERKVYDINEPAITDIIAQDPLQAVAVARGDLTEDLMGWLANKGGFLTALAEPDRRQALNKLRTFFDVEAWMESYRHVDGVLGTRIHGVNLGWQCGRAAFVASYDLRTEELAETMGIPMLKMQALAPDQIMRHFDEEVERRAPEYDRRRADLAGRFMALLEVHDVTPSSGVFRLGGSGPPVSAPQPAIHLASTRAAWGFLEQYNRQRIAGWVASSDESAPRIIVKLDGQEIQRCTPTKERPDLGKNAWGFEVLVPAAALVRDVMRVEAIVEDTGKQLNNSPVTHSFAVGDEAKVLRGRDGWLFLQNDTNGVIDQIKGRRILSVADLAGWTRFLLSLNDMAAEQKLVAFYLVAPNKECVFAEHLPDIAVSRERPIHQLGRLIESLGLLNVSLVYPLDALRQPGAYLSYPKGDSHWTHYGAVVAFRELVTMAKGDLGEIPKVPEADDYRIEYANTDLLSKLGGRCVEPQPVLKQRPSVERVGDNGVTNTGRILKYRSRVQSAAGGLLFVHDSFGDWLLPHLAARFADTTSVWGTSLDAALIREVRPSAVVFQRAERFLITPPRPISEQESVRPS